MEKVVVGIDFGSKLSGFTALAVSDSTGVIHLFQSEKKKSADLWLKEILARFNPDVIGIDAPLSLPGVYKGLLGTKNYHYRECDQQVGAMSPLFLGGLTARAMELKSWAEQSLSSTVIEVYPKLMAKKIALDPKLYKKSREYLSEAFEHLSKDHSLGINTNNSIDNWHQFDALLALATSLRFATGIAEEIGRKDEGIIYF